MHLIQQNILDIECSSSSFGKEVQSSIGNIMEKEFYPKVALLLDQYSRDNHTWKIENLEIQLPTLSKKNWKEQFVQHSLLQIEEYLKSNSSYLELLQKQEISSYESLIPFEKQAFYLFIEYLKTGLLLENSRFKSLVEIEKNCAIDDSNIKEIISLFEENPNALIRFIFNINKKFQEEVASKITQLQIRIKSFLNNVIPIEKTHLSKTEYQQWVTFFLWVLYFFKPNNTSQKNWATTLHEYSKQYWGFSEAQLSTIAVNLKEHSKTNSVVDALNDFVVIWDSILSLDTKDKLQETTKDKISNSNTEERNLELKLQELFAKVNLSNEQPEEVNGQNKLEAIYIKNAGLVLFHPFLESLFSQLDLYKDGDWASKKNQHKAVLLTQYLIYDEEKIAENELTLNKILCGLAIENVVNIQIEFSEYEIEKCQKLLQAVLQHWKVLKDTSIQGLRETFLQRDGKIVLKENETIELWVEQKGVDILLAQLPWGISMIQTPWMENYLHCNWD
ncbi:contractile injection system tape measure protein [Flavobacterium aestivum]|uniref:contractile injection system tape measure protein n=1 Tax=Flavobacterium aestivum TaxID=3003257 RepID=UPI002285F698|nr:contractile injection system tape measure protein [Flavobacterium aestivum]